MGSIPGTGPLRIFSTFYNEARFHDLSMPYAATEEGKKASPAPGHCYRDDFGFIHHRW